jgi:hypothetical protein
MKHLLRARVNIVDLCIRRIATSGLGCMPSHMKRSWSRTLASLLPFGFLLSAGALQITSSSPITQVERSPGRLDSSLEGVPPSGQGVMQDGHSWGPSNPSPVPPPFDAQDAKVGQAQQKDDSSEAHQKVKKTKRESRGSIVAAPIPISSPAIGSGVVLASP